MLLELKISKGSCARKYTMINAYLRRPDVTSPEVYYVF
jgi:hypothetical protein